MDFNTKEAPDVIILDDEDCPFTIFTVKIGENGAIEETNEPVIKLAPPMIPPNYQQVQHSVESDKTDNSDDWTDDVESPDDATPVQQKNKKKRRKKGHLSCPHCRRTFTRTNTLYDHIKTHTGEKPYKCSTCNREFIKKSNLTKHIIQNHPKTQPLICSDCKISFTTSDDYTKHMKTHANAWEEKQSSSIQVDSDSDAAEISYTCAFCDREFPNQESLASHTAYHTGLQSPNSFICKDDPAVVKPEPQSEDSGEESDDELLDQGSRGSFSCKYCGKQFPTRSYLKYHERTHSVKPTFRCPICKKGFDKRHVYDRHILAHSAETGGSSSLLVNCKYCGKPFDSKVRLSYHERTHRIKRRFRCPICRCGFDVKQAYNRHYKKHLTESTVKTKIKKEETEQQQSTEIRNQQKPKSLNCKYCGKLFDSERSLSYHERTHNIQRKYYCYTCKRGFNLAQKYYGHMRKHPTKPVVKNEHQEGEDSYKDSTPRPLSCKYCGKFCPTKITLSYHERSHKVQRTFHCSICKMGYNNKLKFDRHMRLHQFSSKTSVPLQEEESGDESPVEEGEKSLNCKYCGKELPSLVSLSYHERTHRTRWKLSCSICKRGFKTQFGYDQHCSKPCVKPEIQTMPIKEEPTKKSLQNPDSLNCKYCGKYCKTKVSLSYHERTHKIKRTFRCFVCRRGFDNKETYDRHVRLHQSAIESADRSSNPQLFTCKLCDANFSTEQSFLNHKETHANQWAFRCSVCNKGFNRQQTYDRHIMNCTKPEKEEADKDKPPGSPESYFCKYCGKQCDTKSRLSHHERTHKIKRNFYCSECDKGFFSRQAYIQHRQQHKPKTHIQAEELKPYRCNICGLRVSTKGAFTSHFRSHDVEFPYKCSVCDERFKYPSRLLMHAQTHIELFSCSVCDGTFARQEDLNLHMSRVHNASSVKPFSCKHCGKGFMSKLHLFHHERAHKMKTHLLPHPAKMDGTLEHLKMEEEEEEERVEEPKTASFSCKVCGKHFSKKLSLKQHASRHKVKYNFPCSACHRRFTKKSTYEAHMRKHAEESASASDQRSDEETQSNSGEIIFSCPNCDKELPTEQALNAHMDNHAKNDSLKPFRCDTCGARFEERQWLESHMEIHTLDRSSMFSCNVCKEQFATHSKYETHMKSHREKGRFSCTVCSKSFNRPCKLRNHAREHAELKTRRCTVALRKIEIPPSEDKGELSFRCEECGKLYSSTKGLEFHRRTHLQQVIRRTYRCSVCNLEFHKRLAYEWHVKIHCPKSEKEKSEQPEGEEPTVEFSCEECGEKFNTDDSWEAHKRTHLQQIVKRTFRCSVCNMEFNKRLTYEWHAKIHCPTSETEKTEQPEKGEEPSPPEFSCEDCGAKFSTDAGWEAHKRTHKRKYTFNCASCNRGFENGDVYELHMNAHHSKEIEETAQGNAAEN